MTSRRLLFALFAAIAGVLVSDAVFIAPAQAACTVQTPCPLPKVAVGTYNIKNPDEGSWDRRAPKIADSIVVNGVKLMGVQELYKPAQRNSFLQHLNDRAGGNRPYQMVPDPNVMLEGLDSRVVWDSRVFTYMPGSAGSLRFNNQVPGDGTPRWMAWAKFFHRASGKYFLFVTTHLTPNSDQYDVYQWKQLIRQVNVMRSASSAKPLWVIIAGDFNTSKFEPPAKTQLSEMVVNGYHDVVGQRYRSYTPYRLPEVRTDAYISTSNRGERDIREYSVSTDKIGNGIDYVFVSKAFKVSHYFVYARPRTGYLLNLPIASDHFLVKATIYTTE